MIRITEIPEQRKVVAQIKGCRYDALNKITKIIGDTDITIGNTSKYLMPDRFSVHVICHPEDQYDFNVGRELARKKLMSRYYASLDKRLKRFERSLADCTQAFKKSIDK